MPNPRTREYQDILNPDGDLLRVRFTTDRGAVVQYAVQYEVNIDGRRYPAVRYDSAHGIPHRDLLDWEGRLIDKMWLNPASFDEAFTDALASIKQLWPRFRDDFLRRKP